MARLSYGQYVGTTSRDEGTPLADSLKNEFFDTNLDDWDTTTGSTEVSISHKVGQAEVSEDGTNGHGVLWQQGNGVLVSGKKY